MSQALWFLFLTVLVVCAWAVFVDKAIAAGPLAAPSNTKAGTAAVPKAPAKAEPARAPAGPGAARLFGSAPATEEGVRGDESSRGNFYGESAQEPASSPSSEE